MVIYPITEICLLQSGSLVIKGAAQVHKIRRWNLSNTFGADANLAGGGRVCKFRYLFSDVHGRTLTFQKNDITQK